MEAQLSLPLSLNQSHTYVQRGTNVLQTIFKGHFQDFADSYEEKDVQTYGRFRIERIAEVVENFISCGDYTQGIARIKWTFPKILRSFFRHDRNLFSEISPLIFKMLRRFYNEAAGKNSETAAVLTYQSAGDFVRFNPHFHGIVLEGGFDEQGRFIHVPLGNFHKCQSTSEG